MQSIDHRLHSYATLTDVDEAVFSRPARAELPQGPVTLCVVTRISSYCKRRNCFQYDTMRWAIINVCSKANGRQLNVLHGSEK